MRYFDVFNGDADGICALQQLRLAQPLDSTLVTGVKRDIALLARVGAEAEPGDRVSVLDIALDRNREALLALLGRGVEVDYFDHHFAGDIPVHPHLVAHIDTSPAVCTSMLVDRHLGGAHRAWAVVAAFGDNLLRAGEALARSCDLQRVESDRLRALGESINYNGYGDSEDDLLIRPAELYAALQPYANPLDFASGHPVVAALDEGRRRDMDLARGLKAEPGGGALYILPDAPWARRVEGVFANTLANDEPQRAHALLVPNTRGHYTVSVRAPVVRPRGADALCRRFEGGGGRAAAAGIDDLPVTRLAAFAHAFADAFPS